MALMLALCTLSYCHMCLVLFLPVYCLFKCFRRSHVFGFFPKPAHVRVSEALLLALQTLSLFPH